MRRRKWDGRGGRTTSVVLSPFEREIALIAGSQKASKGLLMALYFAHDNWPAFAQWMVDNGEWLDVRAHKPADER